MSTERRIPTIKMEGATYEEAVNSNRDLLSAAIVEAVEFAIETGAQEVEVFEVEELDLVFSLTRAEMKTALNGCLGYYESVEDYITCVKIVNLKTNI